MRRLATVVTAFGLLLLLLSPAASFARQDILADPTRPDSDRQRDPGSRPLEVFAWMGVEPGMAVADILPGGGYNTHVLGRLVGADGGVIAAYTNDPGKIALEERFASAGMPWIDVQTSLAAVADGSVDRHVTVRNIHDLFIPSIAERFGLDPDGILGELRRTLADDGYLCVIDARTPNEGVDENTHRVNQETVIRELQARGFELVDSSELLAVQDDDPSQGGFPTRWDVDRMLLKFRKAR